MAYNLRDNPELTRKAKEADLKLRKRQESPTRSSEDVTNVVGVVTLEGTEQGGAASGEDRERIERETQDIRNEHQDDPVVSEDVRIHHEEFDRGDSLLNPNSPDRHSTKSLPVQESEEIPHYIRLILEQQTQQTQQTQILTQTLNEKLEQQAQQTQILAQTLNEKIDNQATDIIKILNKELQKEITKAREEILTEVRQEMTDQKTQVDKLYQQHKKDTQNKLDNIQTDIILLNSQTEQKLTTFQNKNEESVREVHNEIIAQRIETRQVLEECNKLELRTKELEQDVSLIKDRPIMGNGVSEIYVTCTGGILDQNLPKFNGRDRNPLEFISKFKAYMSRLKNSRGQHGPTFKELLENCLEGTASRWWQVVKSGIDSMEDAEREITEKYWNTDIQKGIKRRMEIERYRPEGKLSRAEYFIDRVLLISQMTPKPDERDIVLTLSEHFETRIQDARRVQNITTVKGFEQLLDREDLEERNHMTRETQTKHFEKQKYNSERPNSYNNRKFEENYMKRFPQPASDNYRNNRPQPHLQPNYPRPNTFQQHPNTQPFIPRQPNPRFNNYNRGPDEKKYKTREQDNYCQTLQFQRTPGYESTPPQTSNTSRDKSPTNKQPSEN